MNRLEETLLVLQDIIDEVRSSVVERQFPSNSKSRNQTTQQRNKNEYNNKISELSSGFELYPLFPSQQVLLHLFPLQIEYRALRSQKSLQSHYSNTNDIFPQLQQQKNNNNEQYDDDENEQSQQQQQLELLRQQLIRMRIAKQEYIRKRTEDFNGSIMSWNAECWHGRSAIRQIENCSISLAKKKMNIDQEKQVGNITGVKKQKNISNNDKDGNRNLTTTQTTDRPQFTLAELASLQNDDKMRQYIVGLRDKAIQQCLKKIIDVFFRNNYDDNQEQQQEKLDKQKQQQMDQNSKSYLIQQSKQKASNKEDDWAGSCADDDEQTNLDSEQQQTNMNMNQNQQNQNESQNQANQRKRIQLKSEFYSLPELQGYDNEIEDKSEIKKNDNKQSQQQQQISSSPFRSSITIQSIQNLNQQLNSTHKQSIYQTTMKLTPVERLSLIESDYSHVFSVAEDANVGSVGYNYVTFQLMYDRIFLIAVHNCIHILNSQKHYFEARNMIKEQLPLLKRSVPHRTPFYSFLVYNLEAQLTGLKDLPNIYFSIRFFPLPSDNLRNGLNSYSSNNSNRNSINFSDQNNNSNNQQDQQQDMKPAHSPLNQQTNQNKQTFSSSSPLIESNNNEHRTTSALSLKHSQQQNDQQTRHSAKKSSKQLQQQEEEKLENIKNVIKQEDDEDDQKQSNIQIELVKPQIKSPSKSKINIIKSSDNNKQNKKQNNKSKEFVVSVSDWFIDQEISCIDRNKNKQIQNNNNSNNNQMENNNYQQNNDDYSSSQINITSQSPTSNQLSLRQSTFLFTNTKLVSNYEKFLLNKNPNTIISSSNDNKYTSNQTTKQQYDQFSAYLKPVKLLSNQKNKSNIGQMKPKNSNSPSNSSSPIILSKPSSSSQSNRQQNKNYQQKDTKPKQIEKQQIQQFQQQNPSQTRSAISLRKSDHFPKVLSSPSVISSQQQTNKLIKNEQQNKQQNSEVNKKQNSDIKVPIFTPLSQQQQDEQIQQQTSSLQPSTPVSQIQSSSSPLSQIQQFQSSPISQIHSSPSETSSQLNSPLFQLPSQSPIHLSSHNSNPIKDSNSSSTTNTTPIPSNQQSPSPLNSISPKLSISPKPKSSSSKTKVKIHLDEFEQIQKQNIQTNQDQKQNIQNNQDQKQKLQNTQQQNKQILRQSSKNKLQQISQQEQDDIIMQQQKKTLLSTINSNSAPLLVAKQETNVQNQKINNQNTNINVIVKMNTKSKQNHSELKKENEIFIPSFRPPSKNESTHTPINEQISYKNSMKTNDTNSFVSQNENERNIRSNESNKNRSKSNQHKQVGKNQFAPLTEQSKDNQKETKIINNNSEQQEKQVIDDYSNDQFENDLNEWNEFILNGSELNVNEKDGDYKVIEGEGEESEEMKEFELRQQKELEMEKEIESKFEDEINNELVEDPYSDSFDEYNEDSFEEFDDNEDII